jgi:hypothetical protein
MSPPTDKAMAPRETNDENTENIMNVFTTQTPLVCAEAIPKNPVTAITDPLHIPVPT